MSVPVSDPYGVAADNKMPFLAAALNPTEAERALRHTCGLKAMRLNSIRVTRYKPGRRCLIEYDVVTASGACLTLVGKARAKGADSTTVALMQKLRRAGFNDSSSDNISVPEPMGIVPAFGMWLQRKVPGVPASQVLVRAGGVKLARRVAEAAHKLHQVNLPTVRCHTPAGELAILNDLLAVLARSHPDWSCRLGRLQVGCHRLAAELPHDDCVGIHRDFYPDQVLIDESRIYLLDFDLYCVGDPALDAGNFVGHLTEQSLRRCNDPDRLADREIAFTETFSELTGRESRARVQVYAVLTLARHVALSVRFPERRPWTARLLDLCELRLRDRMPNLAHRPR